MLNGEPGVLATTTEPVFQDANLARKGNLFLASATALFILQIWTEQNGFIDAVALNRAAFAWRDVVNARANIHALNHAHPTLDPQATGSVYDCSCWNRAKTT
jgi:hypothetical protein